MADFAELYDGYNNDGLAEHVFIIDFAAGLTGTNSQGTGLDGTNHRD
jgi:hypothetical protein